MNVLFARRAELDVARIGAWWRANREKAPVLFAVELAGAVALLEVMPDIGRLFARRPRGDVRRLLLPDTRYHAYYRWRLGEDELVIVRVWSAVRGQPPRL